MTDAFTYRGISIDIPGPYYLQGVEGWAEVSVDYQDVAASGGHGSLLTPGSVKSKTVTVSGTCADSATRDDLFRALRAAVGAGIEAGGTSPLVGDLGGLVLTADAQLSRWQAKVEQARWTKGVFGFDIQFRCADPRFYGPQQSAQSFLALPGTGLALPTTLPATIPANPVGGLFNVTNDGNASAPAIYTLTGPLSAPGVLLNGGTSRQVLVQYDFALSDSDSLVINTSDGGAGYLNGVYRAPIAGSGLTSDLVLRPGDNSVQALGVASVGDPGSSITVTFRPAYW